MQDKVLDFCNFFFSPTISFKLKYFRKKKKRQKLGVWHLIPQIHTDFSELDVQNLQNETLVEKDRHRHKVFGEGDGWENESYREKGGQR